MTLQTFRRMALRGLLVLAFALIASGGHQDWLQVAAQVEAPDAREFHSAVYEPRTQRMIIFGGRRAAGDECVALNDTWILTNPSGASGPSSWVRLSPDGVLPPARHSHTTVYDATTDRMIVFGGNRSHECRTLARDVALHDDTGRNTTAVARIPFRRVVTDEYDPNPTCGIVSAASSVAPIGTGQDWLITQPLRVHLRSERPRNGVFDARSYTLTVRCTDASGHSAGRSIVVATTPPQGLAHRREVAFTTSGAIPRDATPAPE